MRHTASPLLLCAVLSIPSCAPAPARRPGARPEPAAAGAMVAVRQDPAPAPAAASFSPDGRLVALGTDAEIQIRDVGTLALRAWFPLPGEGLAWSPEGSYLAAGRGRRIHVISLRSGEVRALPDVELQDVEQGAQPPLSFSPDGARLLVRRERGHTLWDTGQGRVVDQRELPYGEAWEQAGWASDSSVFAVMTERHRVNLFDGKSGGQRGALSLGDLRVEAMALAPAAATLALAGKDDERVHLVDLGSGQVMARSPEVPGKIRRIAWAPDGRSLALLFAEAKGGDEQKEDDEDPELLLRVGLWTIKGGPVRVLGRAGQPLSDLDAWLRFSPDGQRIGFGGPDGQRVFVLSAPDVPLLIKGEDPAWLSHDLRLILQGQRSEDQGVKKPGDDEVPEWLKKRQRDADQLAIREIGGDRVLCAVPIRRRPRGAQHLFTSTTLGAAWWAGLTLDLRTGAVASRGPKPPWVDERSKGGYDIRWRDGGIEVSGGGVKRTLTADGLPRDGEVVFLSPRGALLLAVHETRAFLWEVASGRLGWQRKMDGDIKYVTWSMDEERILWLSELDEGAQGRWRLTILEARTGGVGWQAVGKEEDVLIWDRAAPVLIHKKAVVRVKDGGVAGELPGEAVSAPDQAGERVVIRTAEAGLCVYRIAARACQARIPALAEGGREAAWVFSPDGRWLLGHARSAARIEIFDSQSGRQAAALADPMNDGGAWMGGDVVAVPASPDVLHLHRLRDGATLDLLRLDEGEGALVGALGPDGAFDGDQRLLSAFHARRGADLRSPLVPLARVARPHPGLYPRFMR